jgi:hypothetical protein
LIRSNTNLDIVEQFDTYEDYLDSQLTETDMNYLEDEEMARQLVELGYRGLGDTIRREDFEARKKLLHEKTNQKHAQPKQLASADKDLSKYPFLEVIDRHSSSDILLTLIHSGRLSPVVRNLFVQER